MDFGLDPSIYRKFLEIIAGLPRMNSVDASVLQSRLYDELHGICIHGDDPLTVFEYHEVESKLEDDPRMFLFRQYRENNIHEYGLSFNEFIQQPTFVNRMLVELSISDSKKEDEKEEEE